MTASDPPHSPPPSDAAGSFSGSGRWALARTMWTVSIVPRTTPLSAQIAILLGVPVIGIVLGLVVHEEIWMFLALSLGIMIWGSLKLLDTIKTRKGPWFVFRIADGIVELPRLKVTIGRAERKEFLLQCPASPGRTIGIELNLSVHAANGVDLRWPLVCGARAGQAGESDIEQLAEALSSATAIPVRRA